VPAAGGDQPGHPAAGQRRSHRQMVAGSTPNASAARPCDAARSHTSCTAASRRPASSPAFQAKAASARTATSSSSSSASRPTPGAIPAAPPGSGRRSRLSMPAIARHARQADYLAGISSQTGRERRERHAVNADQPARITRPMALWHHESWSPVLLPITSAGNGQKLTRCPAKPAAEP
jgi:hypothetical protein